MKKLIALFVFLVIIFSLCTIPGYAESESEELSDAGVIMCILAYTQEGYKRNLITDAQRVNIVSMFDLDKLKNEGIINEDAYTLINIGIKNMALPETNYSFGQGTFIVGQDLKAGTYDITCKSTSDESLSSSMSEFSDIYSSYGMDEYASMFGSLGSMYDSMSGMSVTIYKNGGGYDEHLTLKVDETARIILEDGGRLELSDGTAELTWIR